MIIDESPRLTLCLGQVIREEWIGLNPTISSFIVELVWFDKNSEWIELTRSKMSRCYASTYTQPTYIVTHILCKVD